MSGVENGAQAQTADYFSTPWIVAPIPSNQNNSIQNSLPAGGAGNSSSSAHSSLYARAVAQSAPNAPSWTLSEHLGIDEIATDNVRESQSDRTADLGSLFSAGGIATADLSRLSGILSATGVYRRNIDDTAVDGFTGYGYASARATIITGLLYFNMHGMMDDISREQGGLQNALVQSPQDTQTYSVSGSPILYSHVDDIGINVLRYQIGQSWFVRNTGAIQTPGLDVGPLTSSTNQMAREDFKIAGTLFPRLMSDVSLSASENDSGLLGSGDFTRERGELINEYEVTRFASAITGAGYERLHDNEFPNVDGDGLVWDVGVRLQPDPDSYALLTYGRHDLRSDFGGELVWRLSPLTNIYAAYSDSITNAQQSLLANSDTSELGPEGTVTRVSFDESTLIGTLDDELLNATPGGGTVESPLGVPLTDINNALPLQNGLFRIKSFRATGHTVLADNPLSLTLLHLESTQLTTVGQFGGQAGRVEITEGAILSWAPGLTRQLSGLVSLQYNHVDLGNDEPFQFNNLNPSNSDHYGASLGLTQVLSGTLTAVLRYDFIYSEAHPSSASFYQNAVTIGLHKTFD